MMRSTSASSVARSGFVKKPPRARATARSARTSGSDSTARTTPSAFRNSRRPSSIAAVAGAASQRSSGGSMCSLARGGVVGGIVGGIFGRRSRIMAGAYSGVAPLVKNREWICRE
jgi:hypothetical protein